MRRGQPLSPRGGQLPLHRGAKGDGVRQAPPLCTRRVSEANLEFERLAQPRRRGCSFAKNTAYRRKQPLSLHSRQLPLHRGAKETAECMPPLCKGRWQTDEGRLTEGLPLLQRISLGGQPLSPRGGQLPLHRGAKGNSARQAPPLCARRVSEANLEFERLAQPKSRTEHQRAARRVGAKREVADGRRTSDGRVAPFAEDIPRGSTPQSARRTAPPFAPKCPFRTFRCCAWLIGIREHAVLSYPKHSCFRFAVLTLRVSSHRNAPLGRSGVPVGLFVEKSTLYSFLQISSTFSRFATYEGSQGDGAVCLPCVLEG